MTVMNWMTILPVALFFLYVLISRSRYKNKPSGEPFFFEGSTLVLDAVLSLHSIPVNDIDHVELRYCSSAVPYSVSVNVIKKNGKTKASSYMGHTSPADMVETLKKRGIHCEVFNE